MWSTFKKKKLYNNEKKGHVALFIFTDSGVLIYGERMTSGAHVA